MRSSSDANHKDETQGDTVCHFGTFPRTAAPSQEESSSDNTTTINVARNHYNHGDEVLDQHFIIMPLLLGNLDCFSAVATMTSSSRTGTRIVGSGAAAVETHQDLLDIIDEALSVLEDVPPPLDMFVAPTRTSSSSAAGTRSATATTTTATMMTRIGGQHYHGSGTTARSFSTDAAQQ